MKLLSVNVGKPREVPYGKRTARTAIFKEPVSGRVLLRRLNLEGDAQADLRVHGGADKAVYAYPVEHYDHWKRDRGADGFTNGQFGENFTVEGMPEDQIHIGDIFRVGTATVQVSQPRTPCYKLGIRMGWSEFPRLFLESGRVGFYLRVLEEGEVGAGDPIERISVDPERVTVREASHLMYFDQGNQEAIRKALRVQALAPGWRQAFEELLP